MFKIGKSTVFDMERRFGGFLKKARKIDNATLYTVQGSDYIVVATPYDETTVKYFGGHRSDLISFFKKDIDNQRKI